MARQSNMELCRLVSIVLVMLVHSTFQSVGWDCSSFGILLLAAFSIIGVDVFVLITGFFSTVPKRISLANLLFICFFWMVFRLAVRFAFDQAFRWEDCFFCDEVKLVHSFLSVFALHHSGTELILQFVK